MGLFSTLLFGGIVAYGIKSLRNEAENVKRKKEEEERRRNSVCRFEDGITEKEFEEIVLSSTRKITRLVSVIVDGPVIYGNVESQSGLSRWNFSIDFNDYGHVTGRYWISSDNEQSNIPEIAAKRICESIQQQKENTWYNDNENETTSYSVPLNEYESYEIPIKKIKKRTENVKKENIFVKVGRGLGRLLKLLLKVLIYLAILLVAGIFLVEYNGFEILANIFDSIIAHICRIMESLGNMFI